MSTKRNNKGFTIIELMFSTVIFSFILLLSLAALLQIGKLYYKGVTTAQTQQAARNIMDELTQSIQLSAGGVNFPPGPIGPNIAAGNAATGVFCIGDTRYNYAIDRKLTETSPSSSNKEIYHAFWADKLSKCSSLASIPTLSLTTTSPGGIDGRELLGAHMRVLRLDISRPIAGNDEVWKLDLTVGYGDEDLFTYDSGTNRKYCKTAQAGTQFCATSELSTIVSRRL